MSSIFSYESKINQILVFLTDMILLNILFLVCSLPILTIGAAQAGLHTGITRLLDPKDDGSVLQAFWKGFRNGFRQITGAFIIHLLLLVLALCSCLVVLSLFPKLSWLCLLCGALLMTLQTVTPVFHASFGCTVSQLLRNTFLVVCANPLRSLLTTLILWLPVIAAIWNPYLFLQLLPLWLIGFYSLAALLMHWLLKKPLRRLKEQLS